MPREAYPAARTVSPKLHAYFAGQAEGREGGSQERAAVPDTQTIESIIDAAFWASLRREEGYIPRISLAFLAPGHAKQALIFERPLAVDPAILTRVAPAVERAGIHLGVWHDPENGLAVWGAARGIPKFCFVVEVAAAGLIVIKNHSAERPGKFVNVAVLEGDQVKVVNRPAPSAPEDPSLLGFGSPVSWAYSAD